MGNRHRNGGGCRLSTSSHSDEKGTFLEFEDDLEWGGDSSDEPTAATEVVESPIRERREYPARPDADAEDAAPSRFDNFSRRILALFADVALVFITNVIAWAIGGDLPSQIVGVVASAAYFTYFEGRPGGQTLGKRWMGLRVIDLGGREAIGYPRALLRWVGRILALIPAGLGCARMLWNRDQRTWQDSMAGTVVVHHTTPLD